MGDSLKEQLLNLGFRAVPEAKAKPSANVRPKSRNQPSRPAAADGQQIDLAKAYALRMREEQRARAEAERARQEAKRRKLEAKAAVDAVLAGNSRNSPEADIARHFNYAGKIRRVYVTPIQLQQLNTGELGIVQHNGRFHLVAPDVLRQVAALLPALVVPLEGSADAAAATGYEDPKFQVPDDLIW